MMRIPEGMPLDHLTQEDLDDAGNIDERRLLKAERALLNLLRARYTDGGEPYAITEACILLGHQMRYAEDRKPPYKANRCFCGKVVEGENETPGHVTTTKGPKF